MAFSNSATAASCSRLRTEDKSERGMRLGQIGVELHGLAGQLMRPVEGSRVEIVAIQRVEPGCNMGLGKHGVGAGVVGVDREGLLQQAPRLVKLGRLP